MRLKRQHFGIVFGIAMMALIVFAYVLSIAPSGNGSRTVRMAYVRQTFTIGAYAYWSGKNSFYAFYDMHDSVKGGTNVTDHLNLLTSPILDKMTETTMNPAHVYPTLTLLGDIQAQNARYSVAVLNDSDVDSGLIFDENGKNTFDILLLGHQEYVTLNEYDNFKKFVSNGGTLIALDSNPFYAQVSLNRAADTVTLVRGHSWAYNGKTAWRAADERWGDDISSWVGGKTIDCPKCKITFSNNPFNYTSFEEQYMTNPNDRVIQDYRSSDSRYPIASYELNYGKGSVIVFGIYSDHVIGNSNFISFFNRVLNSAAAIY